MNDRTRAGGLAAALLLAGLVPAPAAAVVLPGDVAPNFHKTDLDGVPRTLYEHRGQVVVMFLLGYN